VSGVRKIVNSTYITLDGSRSVWICVERAQARTREGHRAVRLRPGLAPAARARPARRAAPAVGFRLADATTPSDGIVDKATSREAETPASGGLLGSEEKSVISG
jgi:hypothetical protein